MCQLDSPCAIKTKKKLAGALKELMQTTTFDKITVSDITEKCNVHRQTFYYHFQDRYELLDWIFAKELIEPFTDNINSDNLQEKVYNLFETMAENKKFYQHALQTNSDDLIRYISKIASEQYLVIFKNVSKESGINSDDEADELMAEFFGYGICGIVMSWALRGMKEPPKAMTDKLDNFFINYKKIKS
ncbi:MAG: dihydroxyacetone kinase transcriptional activator DhaS [Ruminococcaceae bacterium]|nr:dihydroxyacetone kinase transcriptional activator DhaS [Oscillospiraceae bacterium]